MVAQLGLAIGLAISNVAASSIGAVSAANSSALAGHWTGAVSRDGAIQILDVDLHGDGQTLAGTFDIPELGLYREPLTDLALEGDAFALHFLYGTFHTVLRADVDEITGINSDWGPPVRIHLKRAEPRAALRYEEVRFENGGAKLVGTLVLPARVQRAAVLPAVVVLAGSSPQGRHDGKSAWTYRSWGEISAEHGVAALVYDKRGIGESNGDIATASFDDQAGDVVAAIDVLARHPSIDAKHIGLIGISQGGWVAPIVAVRDPRVAFVVLDVGPAVSVREQELDRVENTLRANGSSEEEIAAATAYTRSMLDTAYGERSWKEFEPIAKDAAAKPWAQHVDVAAKPSDLEWWKRHEYDPSQTLARLKCPLLALFGAEDPLVPPRKNALLMQELLRKAGNPDVTLRTFPGVEHGCEVPRRLTGDDWAWPKSYWVWSKKASGFYATIFEWIAKRTSSD
jgi:pimeloyl-ACP methyl ester carboxylesterase